VYGNFSVSGNQISGELGKACSTHADEIIVRKLNARDRLEDLGIDSRIILNLILKKVI
jgi:hypothetical protein